MPVRMPSGRTVEKNWEYECLKDLKVGENVIPKGTTVRDVEQDTSFTGLPVVKFCVGRVTFELPAEFFHFLFKGRDLGAWETLWE